MCTACHAITLYLLKLLLTMSRSYSPMCLLTQTQNASSGALHLCTASHAITLYLLKVSVTMSRIYSPMCLSTQGQNVPSRALHLCTGWHAITLYLLKVSITMSRIYSPMFLPSQCVTCDRVPYICVRPGMRLRCNCLSCQSPCPQFIPQCA